MRHDRSPISATTRTTIAENASFPVLVVDDTKEVREVIACFLRRLGYRVVEAADGLAAQRIIRTEHPVLVISDLEMPVSDGWAVLEFCHAKYPGVPILIVSGAQLGTRPEVECWAAGLLPKPFGLDQLRTAVQRLVPLAA